MKKGFLRGKSLGTKFGAMAMAVALSMSSLSGAIPGSVANAEEIETEEVTADSASEEAKSEEVETEEATVEPESEGTETEEVKADTDSEEIQVEEVTDETIDVELNTSDVEKPSIDEADGVEAGLLGTNNSASYEGGVKVWGYLEGDIGPEPVEFGFQGSFIEIVHDGDSMYPKRIDYGPPVKAEVVDGMYSAYILDEIEYDVVALNKYYEIIPVSEEQSADVFPHGDDEIRLDLNLTRRKKEIEGRVKYGPDDISYTIVFVDDEDGERTEALVDDEYFWVELVTGRTYTVALEGISGYSVSQEKLKLKDDQTNVTIQLRKERSFDAEKGDVWDFSLGTNYDYYDSWYHQNIYNGRLDEQTINDFYPGEKSASIGSYMSSFVLDDGDFEFHNGGNPAKLYSKNTRISRYADEEYAGFNGYLVCNNETGDKPYVIIACQKDQVVTVYYAKVDYGQYPEMDVVGLSNSSTGSIESKSDDGCLSFVAPESGKYKIYSKNDYFGFKEIRREFYIHVSGKVYAPMGPMPTGQFSLIFSGIEVPVIDGKYDAMLPKQGYNEHHMYYRYRRPYYRLSLSKEAEAFDILSPSEQYDIESSWGYIGDPEEYLPPENLYIDNKSTENCDIPIYPNVHFKSICGNLYGAPEEYLHKIEDAPYFVVLWELISSPCFSGEDKGGAQYSDCGWIDDMFYPGDYLVTVKNEETGLVYSRKIVSGREDIDVTYGDYETRDREARIICDIEGATVEEFSEAVFWFTSKDHIDGYGDGSYRSCDLGIDELSYGIARLPKGHKYVINASGLPEGMSVAGGKQLNLYEENCVDGKYSYTVIVRPADQMNSLKDFGAKGDGKTDDTEAVKRALEEANGRALYVPAGKYCVSSIEVFDIPVEMYSEENAVFYKTDSKAKPIIQFNNCESGKITGISFDAGSDRLGAGADTSCISFIDSSNIEISDCEFSNTASSTVTFFGNCFNIDVSDNKFSNANGAVVFGKGTVRHAFIENNVAHGAQGNGVVILEQGSASDSFDIAVRNNEFRNYTGGSIVQLRNVSDVIIENNYTDGCKYLLMSPKPNSKNFTEPQVSNVKVKGNRGIATIYAVLYTYEENPNTLYSDIHFENNDIETKNGVMLYACDTVAFNSDHIKLTGNVSVALYDSKNIGFEGVSFEAAKASKPLLRFDACDGITLKDFGVDSNRTLMQVTNSENAKITFDGISADFSKLDKALQYSNGLQVTCRNCNNTGKALAASVSNKTVILPMIGNDFVITGSADMHITTVRGNREKGSTITLRCDSNDIYFEKSGNILIGEYAYFPKATTVELEYNGKKWTIKTDPFSVNTSGDCTAAVGETAKYNVTVTGGTGKYTYRWYYSKDGGNTWSKAGFDGASTANMSFQVVARYYKYLFKCRVYDSTTKKEYYSDILKLLEPEVVSFIKTQPKDCTAKVGDKVVFKVEIAGSAKSYVWYRSKDGGKTWGKVYYDGYKTNSMTVPVEKYMDNYLFYCVITDSNGEKHETDTAKITLKK